MNVLDGRPFIRAHIHQGKAGTFAIRINRNDVLIVSAAHLQLDGFPAV